MEEESKAIQEVAKTTGKAIDGAREAGGFIAKFIQGSLEAGLGIFEDKLKYMRWERQLRLMQRAEEFLKLSGMATPTRPVPMKLAIPILQGASLEEDDDLQDRWAALLVNAANAEFEGEVRRSYVSILEQLTPLDAHILDVLYSLSFEDGKRNGLVTEDLPDKVHDAGKGIHNFTLPSEEVIISLSNLVRLGCLRTHMVMGGAEIFERVYPTIAGRAFVHACTHGT